MIRQFLADQLEGLDTGTPVKAKFEVPTNAAYGDFGTSLAFSAAKVLRTRPANVVATWVEILNATSPDIRWDGVGGFLNARVSDALIWDMLLQEPSGLPQTFRSPSQDIPTLLEYVSANPTGPLHVGHGRWAVLGDVIGRMMRFCRIPVSTEFYINDAGSQIDKLRASVAAAKAGLPIPEDGYHGAYIHELAAQDQDPVEANLASQKQILADMGVTFDTWFSERSLHATAVGDALAEVQEKGLSYENEGALWFRSSDFGDEKDRVLIKADGQRTYFAVDIAYHRDKVKRGFGRLVNIWGADHHGYVARVRAGVAALCGECFANPDRFEVLIGQLVSLFRGGERVRMSKRTGEMVTLDEVILEIGSDAFRYFMIQKSVATHLEFDLELAKKTTNENPVYYIQYAHARICSIFRKLGDPVLMPPKSLVFDADERSLALLAVQAMDEVWEATLALAPHRFANYTYDLARALHLFYEACPIIRTDPETQARRLFLLARVREVLRVCLGILGISAPQEM